MRNIQKIVFFFEIRSFGVCTWWARKFGISPSKVKLGFIYTSFFTFGTPIFLYMVMAWILEHKHYFKLQRRKAKNSIWEL